MNFLGKMKLTDEQRENLINILQEVFTEEEVKIKCRNNKRTFGGYLYDKVEGNTADARFSSLVDYLIRKNLIESFLEVCLSNEVSQQTQLNEFYQDSQKIKYKQIFDSYDLKILIDILHKINQNKSVITLYNNYQRTILKQKEYLSTNQLPEYLIVNELLRLMASETSKADILYEIIEPNDSLVLRDFVENFLIKISTIQEIDDDLKKDLKEWIEKNCPAATIDVEFEDKSVNNVINYLFIVIRPRGDNKKFFLAAQFSQFEKNQNKIKEININLDADNINHQGYLEKEIPDLIDKVIKKMYNCVQLSTLPVIELFLPINLLIKDFDIKKITNEWNQKRPICMQYPFTVRCYERFFQNNRLKTVWKQQWKILQELINKIDNNQELISKRIGVLSQQNCTNLNPCVALKIVCPLPQTKKKKICFFQRILSTGVPLCLWTRYKEISNINNISKYFEDILNLKSFKDFCQFYNAIKETRSKKNSNKDDLGYKLGVLFDHDKIPSKDLQLIPPNRFIGR